MLDVENIAGVECIPLFQVFFTESSNSTVMFGLLKQRPSHPDHRSDFRKSYCGTCKAIGKLYGQKERLLLNYDVVFLSELLSELSTGEDDFSAISANRCFSLPKHQHNFPDFLIYAASVNMLLASVKIQDNLEDAGSMSFAWRALAWLQKSKFEKAKRQLQCWGLQMPNVDAIVKEQFRREHQPLYFADIATDCSYYSEMTGMLTGEIFRQGAHTVSRPEVAESLCQIGKAYGEIVYLVDALSDYEKDRKRGDFNPLHAHTTNKEASLSPEVVGVVQELISTHVIIARKHFFELPIAEDKKHLFASRLETAVHAAIYPSHSCLSNVACHTSRISISEKYWLIYNRAKWAFAPARRSTIRLAGAALAAGFMALLLLLWPFRVDASIPASPPPSECSQEIADCCCQCCCDACCEEMCNTNN